MKRGAFGLLLLMTLVAVSWCGRSGQVPPVAVEAPAPGAPAQPGGSAPAPGGGAAAPAPGGGTAAPGPGGAAPGSPPESTGPADASPPATEYDILADLAYDYSTASGQQPAQPAQRIAYSVEGDLLGDGRRLVAEVLELREAEAPGRVTGLLALRIREQGDARTARVLALAGLAGSKADGISLIDFGGDGQPIIVIRARHISTGDYIATATLIRFDGTKLVGVQSLLGYMGSVRLLEGSGKPKIEVAAWYEPPFNRQYIPADMICKTCPKLYRTVVYEWQDGRLQPTHRESTRLAYPPRESAPVEAPIPPEILAFQIRGQLLVNEGKTAEAIPLLQEAATRSKDYPAVWNDLAYAYRLAGKWAESREAAARAVALNPWHTFAQYNLGIALLKLEKPAEAEKPLLIATALQEDRAEPHMTLGQAYEALGNKPRAGLEYIRVLELDPGNVAAAQGLIRVTR